MPVDTLSLITSSPIGRDMKFRSDSLRGLVVPIELENNCSEEGITIESDDSVLTNTIRKHYLEHFGHRDLNTLILDYDSNAILIEVVTSNSSTAAKRTKYHGHDEIRKAYEEIFKVHVPNESSFELKHISCEQKHAIVIWSAKTPTRDFPQVSDTLVFNNEGKIIKQFFSCQIKEREKPGATGLVQAIHKTENEQYSSFFQEDKQEQK